MRADDVFRVALGIIVAALIAVRGYYQFQARQAGPSKQLESRLNVGVRAIGGLGGFVTLVLYLVRPDLLAWASFPLPDVLRVLGVALGFVGIILLAWSHDALRLNFSGTLHIRDEHTLVTSGPYRWIRHPIYTALLAVVLSFFLVSADWLIGAIFIGGLATVILTRVGKEDRLMAERFGSAHVQWVKHTGRFLPRLRG